MLHQRRGAQRFAVVVALAGSIAGWGCGGTEETAPVATTGGSTSATGGAGGSGGDAGPGAGGSGGSTSATGGAGPATSPGCIDGGGLAEGEHQLTIEGLARRYVVRLPEGYDGGKPWPLVLALHGNGGSVDDWDVTDGPRNIRGVLENDAVLIIAEAIDGKWRDYDAPPESWPARIESELDYFDAVIGEARSELCLRDDAIFSMGFSGGGSFSGVLGCRRTDIRAIAVGGSVIYFDEADCVHTPAAWITIGAQELNPGREAFRDYFRDQAGCEATSLSTAPTPCVAYEGCDQATPVHYCEHPDGHVWPDFGSDAMWAFFASLL